VRRSVEDAQERAYDRVFAQVGTRHEEMVAVAGKRWAVEECFATAKGECGWRSKKCGVGRAGIGLSRFPCWPTPISPWEGAERRESTEKKKTSHPSRDALIPLSVPEIRHLLWRLIWQKAVKQWLVLAWSVWRRRHQAKA
jgi:hypothetical protein